MFTSAWDYQAELHKLQGDINEAIRGVIAAVSEVLEKSTSVTLQQYEDHVNEIDELYAPSIEAFERLSPGSCRNSAETQLNATTEFTGFKASNCANQYNNRVKTEVSNANNALIRFDDIYSQVQSIVIKAFVGQNVFLTPEAIEDKIKEIFEIVQKKWEESSPEVESIKKNLADRIGNQNAELGKCHGEILTEAIDEHARFKRMVGTCNDFELSENSVDRFDSTVALHEILLQEFLAEHAKLKVYEWTA